MVLLATWLYSKADSRPAGDYVPLEKTEIETGFDNKVDGAEDEATSSTDGVLKRQD